MDFEDAALLRLADVATRRGVFDDLALEHILDAAFVTSTLGVEGPFDATFDDIRFGAFAPTRVQVDGGWSALGGVDRTEARLEAVWPYLGPSPRVDAVWQGTVIARAVVSSGRIQAVDTVWPVLHSLDDEIDPLPADPVALEQARREVLVARLRAGAAVPDAVNDAFVNKLLVQAGVATVGEFALRHSAERATGGVRVSFAETGNPQPVPRSFPVAVALLVRDASHKVVDLLAESKAIQWLHAQNAERPREPELTPRHPLVVAWVVPSATFDDPGWPGADPGAPAPAARLARRVSAARWLALEGVALVAFDPPA